MTRPEGDELGAVITEFLGDAAAGRVRDRAGRPMTREEVRRLRGLLAHVVSELGTRDVDAVGGRDIMALIDGLGADGLPPGRVDAIVDALRSVYAYAIGRGLVRVSPLVGLAPEAAQTSSPTTAVLALADNLVSWLVRGIVIASVLVAVGLVVALG
jgi:hypothetical protein